MLFAGGLDNIIKLWDMAKVMEDLEAEGISGLGGSVSGCHMLIHVSGSVLTSVGACSSTYGD